MICKICQGTMIPNPRKKPGDPKSATWPDWICNQDNGPCGSTKVATDRNGVTREYHNPTGAWNPKPTGGVPPSTIQKAAPPTRVAPPPTLLKEEPDWEAITDGKIRHGVICAMITAGYDRDRILMEYQDWCDLIKTGTPI